jgi:ligand-binding sensor domain-containing protein
VNGAGLHRLEGGHLVPVAGGEEFATADLRGAIEDGQGTLLVSNKGLLRRRVAGFEPAAPGLAPYLKENAIYSFATLPGGLVVLGTTRGGLLLLDSRHNVIRVLNRASGLPSDYVASLAVDDRQGIWAATDNGIARLDPRFSRFDETHGLTGSVIALAHWRGALYAGTTNGLFRLSPPAPGRPPIFEPIHRAQERFFVLVARPEGLYAGTTTGVFRWDGDALDRFFPAEIVYDLTFSRRDPSVLFAAGRFGAVQLRREGSVWQRVAALAPGGQEFRTVAEDRDGRLWITTLTGVVRADLSQSPPVVTQYAASEGIPDGWKNVYQAGGLLGIATEQGLLRFDEASKRFVPETALGSVR